MTKQYWDSLTQEERLKLFEELENEKEVTSKALQQFVSKEKEQVNTEKWISVEGLHGCDFALKVSDINYIKTDEDDITRIYTKIIHNGQNIILCSRESPSRIVNRINTSNE